MSQEHPEGQRMTPEQAWESMVTTLDRSRATLYTAGWPAISLLWAALVALGYLMQFTVGTALPSFATDRPWFPGPLWGGLALIGMVASSIIGARAGRVHTARASADRAGRRVFLFWVSIMAAAFIVPAASGLWTGAADASAASGVAIGIAALGYVLFGILHHGAIAFVGIGIAAAYYAPAHLLGDRAPLVTGTLLLLVVAVAWTWMRRDRDYA